jgi:sigma-E factor negative regulatory protein RseA
MDRMDDQELISALADGQLQGEAFALGVQAATADARGREAWCAYHLVGEVLRSGQVNPCSAPDAFLARLQQRLQQETPALASLPRAQPAVVEHRPAANDWQWKLAAGLASVAAVAAVGWNFWGGAGGAAPSQAELAAATPAASALVQASAVDPAPARVARDARLDRLLAAHRQMGSATALGSSSGYLLNANFEGPSR